MRKETIETSIKLIEAYTEKGQWAVRWDFKEKEDGLYWYEEEIFYHIPELSEIQNLIITWFNKQTDGLIKVGFTWNGIKVLLTDENKFNYKTIIDEAARRETAIAIWDNENPELAGINYLESEGTDSEGNTVLIATPTGRPKSLLPVTMKLGETNTPENFYTFTQLKELQDFFSAGVDFMIGAYGMGWHKIATFDWAPYSEALSELKQ